MSVENMTFSVDQIEQIEKQIAQTAARVFVMQVDGRQMVIKRQEAARPSWRYAILRGFSRLLREPLLMPAYVPGGAAAQAIEVLRLTRLANAGVPVPVLLHVTPEWFAMSLVGQENLGDILRRTLDIEKKRALWQQGLAAILETHQKGQNLSQVFIRNVMYHDGQIVFIDFEDDPEQSMGLANAQARDWLFFLFGSVWMLDMPLDEAVQLFWQYLQKDSSDVQKALLHSGKVVGWLRFLPSKRKPWGRDVIAAQNAGAVLHALRKLT